MSSPRHVRVRLVYPEDETNQPYTFDLMLDAAGRVVGPGVIFGACGRLDRDDERYPCIVDPHGRIDFGAAMAGADERCWRTDLRNVTVREGAFVTLWSPANQAWSYVVKRVIAHAQPQEPVAPRPAPGIGAG